MQQWPQQHTATALFAFEPEISTGIKIAQLDKLKIGFGSLAQQHRVIPGLVKEFMMSWE